ncbi:MAG: DUF1565 domain-containing protein [Desulfobacterales bacterium]|nr:DUF1565 domain-containing protein [Desulfobacterales bacterium]
MKRLTIFFTILFITAYCPVFAGTVYVDDDSSCTSCDGSSWSTAYQTVEDALDAASAGDDIWVAQGTYTVYNSTDGVYSTVQMKENVNLYGGFSGAGATWNDRDWETYTTTLDGNSQVKHVVTGADNAIIDGFTVTGGKAQLSSKRGKNRRAGTTVDAILESGGDTSGGGMLIFQNAPTVSNCIFDNNQALKGGAVYIMCSTDGDLNPDPANETPTFTNCTFSNNYATMRGGAVSIDVATHPTFIQCTFKNNVCDAKGGGMYNDWGCSPTLINCLIVKNEAARAAGMGNDGASSPKLVNCTIAYNYAYDIGAGIYTGSVMNSTNDPTLVNCIAWGNMAKYGGPTDLSSWHENHFYISYSDIGEGYESFGTGIISQDPLFTDPDNGDFTLQTGSPCINTGTDSDSDVPSTDIDGTARDSSVDMGAYEYTGTVANGSLTVTISPSDIGGQWSTDSGTTWYNSGATATLDAGTYTVTFSTVSGYGTPASQSVTVTAGGTESLTATYTETSATGTLTVTISPSGIGGQWSTDSGTTWYDSGAAATLDAGTYTVTFSTVSGYDSPSGQSVTITDGGSETLTVTYTEQGTAEPYPGYTLFMPINSSTTYLIDNDGNTVHSWDSNFDPALSVYLLENGNLMRTAKIQNDVFDVSGRGGMVLEMASDGTVEWRYSYSSDTYVLHHDIEYMSNGNVLMIAWEYKSYDEAVAAGRNPANVSTDGLYPDTIIEVEPTGTTTGTVVWEWRVWDHLVQDYDSSKSNYNTVADYPELIDLNFVESDPDWTHFNSIDYNEEFDQIMVSVHEFSEIWIIDHSTSAEEAASHTGGTYGKGGDLLYRWGNPQAYGAGSSTDQILYKQHDATWIEYGYPGEDNILIFNNGMERTGGNYSSVEEITPPADANGNYSLTSGSAYEPESQTWTYDIATEYYSSNISGAQRLPNGNTLICSGANGYFLEVTSDKETVWEYTYSDGDVFKVRRYGEDYPGLSGIIDTGDTGTLQVTMEPSDAVTAGAKWSADSGTTWYDSDSAVTMDTGTYTVTFTTVSGWTSPDSQSATVSTDQTTTLTGTYTEETTQTGSLQVTISPQTAIDSGAQWQVDSGDWQDSGDVVSGLSTGEHALSFSRISDWYKPIDRTVTITAGETKIAAGTYREAQGTGIVQVTIEPDDAVDQGAQWNLDQGDWQDSGEMVMNVSAGDHEINFKPVDGWTAPASQTIEISDGAFETVTGTYTQEVVVVSGDADGNGIVNIFDALVVAEYVVELRDELPGAADVAEEYGVINIYDALMIAQYDVGLVSSLCGLRTSPDEDVSGFWEIFRWEDLCPPEQSFWGIMGWDEASWNGDGKWPSSEFKRWADFTENERNVAEKLSYDEISWDIDAVRVPVGDPDSFWHSIDWVSLYEPEQYLWEILGWDEESWTGSADEPDSASKDWNSLSDEEREAAEFLGFDEQSWNVR